jgi:hypothetical protein
MYAVFRGKVIDYHDGAGGTLSAYLVRVDESFKGVPAGHAEVFVDPGVLGPCSTTYQLGEQHLFFATGPGNLMALSLGPTRYPLKWRGKEQAPILMAAACSHSRLASQAAEDLQWLRGGRKTEVYGRVVQTDPEWRSLVEAVPLAGAQVSLRSAEVTRIATSAVDGSFSFPGVNPGEYSLIALRYPGRVATVEGVSVVAGECAERTLFAAPGGRMEGLVLRHDGVPARNVKVELVRIGAKSYSLWAPTDQAGRFAMDDVPAGEFEIGVNLRTPISVDAPWPATRLPAFRTQPKVAIRGLLLILPPPMPTRTVQARVLWSDGATPKTLRIQAEPLGDAAIGESVAWFESGNVLTVRLLRDHAYKLWATWLQEAGPAYVESGAVTVNPGKANLHIELRLPGAASLAQHLRRNLQRPQPVRMPVRIRREHQLISPRGIQKPPHLHRHRRRPAHNRHRQF